MGAYIDTHGTYGADDLLEASCADGVTPTPDFLYKSPDLSSETGAGLDTGTLEVLDETEVASLLSETDSDVDQNMGIEGKTTFASKVRDALLKHKKKIVGITALGVLVAPMAVEAYSCKDLDLAIKDNTFAVAHSSNHVLNMGARLEHARLEVPKACAKDKNSNWCQNSLARVPTFAQDHQKSKNDLANHRLRKIQLRSRRSSPHGCSNEPSKIASKDLGFAKLDLVLPNIIFDPLLGKVTGVARGLIKTNGGKWQLGAEISTNAWQSNGHPGAIIPANSLLFGQDITYQGQQFRLSIKSGASIDINGKYSYTFGNPVIQTAFNNMNISIQYNQYHGQLQIGANYAWKGLYGNERGVFRGDVLYNNGEPELVLSFVANGWD